MKEKVLPYKQKYKGIQGLIVVKPDELNTAITSYTDIGATYNTIVDDFAKRVVERTEELANCRLEAKDGDSEIATLKGQIEAMKLQLDLANLKLETNQKKKKLSAKPN